MVVKLIQQFRNAHSLWKSRGKPVRTPERMQELFDNHCSTCNYMRINRYNIAQCGKCGCCISPDRAFMNKLLYASESCPIDKFGPEQDDDDAASAGTEVN